MEYPRPMLAARCQSYEIARKIACQTTQRHEANGHAAIAKKIADRRMILAGYRLTDVLQQLSANSIRPSG
jgi:hypothetical protein